MGKIISLVGNIAETSKIVAPPTRVIGDGQPDASVTIGVLAQIISNLNGILSNVDRELFPVSAGQIGANVVDTVNVIANAITKVTSATSGSAVNPGTTVTDLVSVSATVTGGVVIVVGLSTIEMQITGTISDSTATMTLLRAAVTLDTKTQRLQYSASFPIIAHDRRQFITFSVETPAAGTYTYKTRGVSTDATTADTTFTEHGIYILELKR
jgi:hypothetical protein